MCLSGSAAMSSLATSKRTNSGEFSRATKQAQQMYKGRLRLRDKQLKQIEAALPLEILISIRAVWLGTSRHARESSHGPLCPGPSPLAGGSSHRPPFWLA